MAKYLVRKKDVFLICKKNFENIYKKKKIKNQKNHCVSADGELCVDQKKKHLSKVKVCRSRRRAVRLVIDIFHCK